TLTASRIERFSASADLDGIGSGAVGERVKGGPAAARPERSGGGRRLRAHRETPPPGGGFALFRTHVERSPFPQNLARAADIPCIIRILTMPDSAKRAHPCHQASGDAAS